MPDPRLDDLSPTERLRLIHRLSDAGAARSVGDRSGQCGDADTGPLDLGVCGQPPEHRGPHISERGIWPQGPAFDEAEAREIAQTLALILLRLEQREP